MKINIYVSGIFILTFFLAGCNTEDQGMNDPKGTSTGFIEFKIDGTKYRIDDYNSNDGNGTVTFANTPSLPLYQVIIVFYTASPSGADNISLHQISQSPIEAKNYEYGDFNALERPTFIQILPSLYGYFGYYRVEGECKYYKVRHIFGRQSGRHIPTEQPELPRQRHQYDFVQPQFDRGQIQRSGRLNEPCLYLISTTK